MLGIFPDPYPDELLLSVCSRYHDRLGYRSRESTGWDLLGANRARVAVDLPSNIDHIVSVLPPYHRYTADRVIYENTLYPIYSAFLSSERAIVLREDMKGNRGGAIHGRAGVLTSKLSTEYLRFCPLCVGEDRKEWSETYWHRLHQVPGVEVCPVHLIFLESSGARARSTRNCEVYVAAERIIHTVSARPLNLSEPDHLTLFTIAQDVAWLLDHPSLTAEPSVARKRYIRLLFERKLANHNGVVNATKLYESFREYYSSDILNLLHCGLERRFNWLRRIVQNSSKGSTQPPLHHLLLMNFLECRAEHFFSLQETQVEPFGVGPWPCLNRASDHFRQLRVTKCDITRTWDKESNPVGHFHCDCGFVYYRVGPDRAPEARHQFSRVESYGDVWYSEVIRIRESEGLTQEEIGLRLGVTHFVIRNQLVQLRSRRLRGEAGPDPESSPSKRIVEVNREILETFRSQWLKAVRENPRAGRAELRKKEGSAYNWLLERDREWFEANSPSPKRSPGPPKLTDWDKKDADLAVAASSSAARIMSAPGRPVRASRTAIAREINALETIYKRGHLLPLTIKAIATVAETASAYAIRRIWWAVECYREQKVIPSAVGLQIRAAVSPQMLGRPAVSKAFTEAIESFRKSEVTGLLKAN
jgi:transcriptional regulator with XRE-family HTH domain